MGMGLLDSAYSRGNQLKLRTGTIRVSGLKEAEPVVKFCLDFIYRILKETTASKA